MDPGAWGGPITPETEEVAVEAIEVAGLPIDGDAILLCILKAPIRY